MKATIYVLAYSIIINTLSIISRHGIDPRKTNRKHISTLLLIKTSGQSLSVESLELFARYRACSPKK